MKDRTITQEPNTGGIRSAVKNELREAQSGVKLTKMNATSLFYSDTPSFPNTKVCACILVETMK